MGDGGGGEGDRHIEWQGWKASPFVLRFELSVASHGRAAGYGGGGSEAGPAKAAVRMGVGRVEHRAVSDDHVRMKH